MKPIPIIIESGVDKIAGFIMKITQTGMLVELPKIPFSAGSIVLSQFRLKDDGLGPLLQSVRSIKHYENYYRKGPPKKKKLIRTGEPPPTTPAPPAKPPEGAPLQPVTPAPDQPMKLIEFHFFNLKDMNRMAIDRFLMEEQVRARRGE
jgi:hypothetical protein